MQADDPRIFTGRITTLIAQQPASFLANGAISVLLAVVLVGAWPTLWIAAWLAAIWVITGLRVAIWWRYRERCGNHADARLVARLLTASALLSGLVWGLPGAIFPPEQTIALQGFVVFVLGGMAAGAVVTLGSYLPAFFAFAVPAFVPTLARLGLEATMMTSVMAAMGLVFLVVIIGTTRTLNRTLTDSLRLQVEKSDLITQLTRARLDAEAASAAKSSFLAMISHELRTPLNAVLGFAQLIEQEVHGPIGHPKYREYLEHVSHSGAHLLQLIDEVMDISRSETGQLELNEEAFKPAPVLARSVELLLPHARRADVSLHKSIDDDLPVVRADPRRLRQILLNVLSNAIKFTPAGGQVKLVARRAACGGITVTVRDTGIGMSKEDLKVAFEYFGRGSNAIDRVIEGTGIGLPLTRYLLALHGGHMELASEPDRGTLVTLHFPAERVIDSTKDRPTPTTIGPAPDTEAAAQIAV